MNVNALQFTAQTRLSAGAIALLAAIWISLWGLAGITHTSRIVLAVSVALALAVHLCTARHRALPSPKIYIPAAFFLVYVLIASVNPHGVWSPAHSAWSAAEAPLSPLPSAADAAYARESLLTLLSGSLALLASVTAFSSPRSRDLLCTVLALLGLSVVLYIPLQHGGFVPQLLRPEATLPLNSAFAARGPFAYHGHAGSFLALTLPFACQLFSRFFKHSIWIVILAYGAAAYAAGSRLGFALVLVVSLACLVLFYLRGPTRSRLTIGLAVISIPAIAGTLFILTPPNQKIHLLGRDLGSARSIMWDITAQAIGQRPLTGHGPGSFPVLLSELAKQNPTIYPNWVIVPSTYKPQSDLSRWTVSCNDYLQALAEFGLLGVAPLAFLAILGVVRIFRACSPLLFTGEPPTVAPCLLLSLATLASGAFLDWQFYLPAFFLIACILLGACLSYPRGNDRHPFSNLPKSL